MSTEDAAIEDRTDPIMNRVAKTPGTVLTKLVIAEIYKDAIQKNLERFKDRYNEKNPDHKISLALTLNKRIFDAVNGQGFIAQASVAVEIRENGLGRILINKVYAFKHTRHMDDEGEWKLTLYSEILYELVGGCITLAILSNPENDIQNGNKDQTETGEQTDIDGSQSEDGTIEGGS